MAEDMNESTDDGKNPENEIPEKGMESEKDTVLGTFGYPHGVCMVQANRKTTYRKSSI